MRPRIQVFDLRPRACTIELKVEAIVLDDSVAQLAEMITARLAWSDGEEGTLKLIDDHTVIVHFDETGKEVYSRYCGALENIDPIYWPSI
ncbi:MAG TPA: hypothetical protein VK673_15490 [Chthoniobacterales bacterium]|nr:hypothetical protein [Chthoniobacterales bacterium]